MGPSGVSFFEFATVERGVYVRAHGHANMNNSHLFRDLIESLLDQGRRLFVIDLAQCAGMDSTFMGVLVGIAMYEADPPETVRPRTMLVNVAEHCARQLGALGLEHLIQVREAALGVPEGVAFERLEERPSEPRSRVKMIEEAHRHLVRVNDRNAALFGPLLSTLAAELAAAPDA